MTAIKLLDHILELFKRSKDNSEILSYLLKHKMVRSSFDQRYLLNKVDFEFILTNKVQKNENLL